MPAEPDPQSARHSTWTITWTTGWIPIVAVALLLGGYYVPIRWLAPLLGELGIACFVAFLLAITIERLSAKEFEQRAKRERDLLEQQLRTLAKEERADLKRDVFYYTYGRNLPQAIRDDLEEYFLRADFIRSHLFLQFVLTIETDPRTNKEYVKSICFTSSTIENLTGKPRAFPIEHSIDPSPSEELKDEVKFLEFKCTGSETEITLTEKDLVAKTQRDASGVALNLPDNVVVLPEQPTFLKIHYQGIRAMEGPGIYFFFTQHTCVLELSVNAKNLDVSAEVSSPRQTRGHRPA